MTYDGRTTGHAFETNIDKFPDSAARYTMDRFWLYAVVINFAQAS